MFDTNIIMRILIKLSKYLHSIILHIIVVGTHEQDIDHDAQGDEELGEGVKHDDGQDLVEHD